MRVRLSLIRLWLGSSPDQGPTPAMGHDVFPLPQSEPPVIDYRHRTDDRTCNAHGHLLAFARQEGLATPSTGLPPKLVLNDGDFEGDKRKDVLFDNYNKIARASSRDDNRAP